MVILEIFEIKPITKYYNHSLELYFEIERTLKLIILKYYWLILYYNVKSYVKGCDLYFLSKVIEYILYNNLYSFSNTPTLVKKLIHRFYNQITYL